MKFAVLALAGLFMVSCGTNDTSQSLNDREIDFHPVDFTMENAQLVYTTLMTQRCVTNRPRHARRARMCANAGSTFGKLLDFGGPRGFGRFSELDELREDGTPKRRFNGIAAFRTQLIRMAASGQAKAAADFMHEQISAAMAEQRSVNLWELAVQHTNGDHRAALEILGVVFQDRIHTAQATFLSTVRGDEDPVVVRIREAVELMIKAQEEGVLTHYPVEGIEEKVSFYHFFVPAYISMRLQEEGLAPNMAQLIAFLFNAEYELNFITLEERSKEDDAGQEEGDDTEPTLGEKIRDAAALAIGQWKPFPGEDYRKDTLDIQLGYVGAQFGHQVAEGTWTGDLSKFYLPAKEEFTEKLPQDPLKKMKELSRKLFRKQR